MKFPKAIRVIYTATLIAVGLLVASTLPQWTPEPIDDLPGRPAGIMAPSFQHPIELPGVRGPNSVLNPLGTDAPNYWVFSPQLLAAHSPKLTNATANLAADTVAALFNSCYLKILDGTQAATADTAIGAQVTLATLRCNATAFGSASSGVATANAIVSDTDAAATGTATWFRFLKSDNTTTIMDGSVGTSGADINLTTVSIAQHATVSVSAFTYTQSKS